jgi:hypothetical protein
MRTQLVMLGAMAMIAAALFNAIPDRGVIRWFPFALTLIPLLGVYAEWRKKKTRE